MDRLDYSDYRRGRPGIGAPMVVYRGRRSIRSLIYCMEVA
jgi:hypothetical protein